MRQASVVFHNDWPPCCVTIQQFCHNAWWCWHNTPCITYSHCVDAAVHWLSWAQNTHSRNFK